MGVEEIDDDYIKEYFKGNKKLVDTNLVKYYYHKSGKKFKKEIYDYVIKRFTDSNSFKESLYRIFYEIEFRPKCKYCGKSLEYKGTSYRMFTDYCNFHCQMKYLNSIKKLNNNESILKGKISREKTLINKYGVDNPFKLKEIRNKIKETFIDKYGVDNPWKSKEIKEKLNYKLQAKHAFETKRKNKSLNTSKAEEEAYEFISRYTNVIRQYNNDIRYPWNCDFYVKDLDLFIECNFHWTHGKHPFNSSSIEDQNILYEWKERSKEHKYYLNAIETWTNRDVKKRNKAKEENLQYLEFWTLEEFKKYFTNYFRNKNEF